MPLILGTNSIKDTGYDVANSLRFNSGSSDSLSKAFSSNGTRTKWTWSIWFKRSKLSGSNVFSAFYFNDSNEDRLEIDSNGQIIWYSYQSDSYVGRLKTNRKFRDISAWMHLVLRWDTGDSTADNRMKIWINGVEETSFAIRNNPSSDAESLFNYGDGSQQWVIGHTANVNHWGGYMAEIVFCDNQKLEPTSFGEFDEDSPTIWKPKDVSGLTFGTNGFYLDFEDSSALGNDAAGSNNFTVNNLTAIDQSTDTCTNNFATMNSLANKVTSVTFSEGNLKTNFANGRGGSSSTFGLTTGKWYVEMNITTMPADERFHLGVVPFEVQVADDIHNTSNQGIDLSGFNAVIYADSGSGGAVLDNFFGNNTTRFDSFTGIIGMALDMTNGTIAFSKAGAWVTGSGTTDTDFSNALKVNISTPLARHDVWHVACGTGNSSGTSGVFEMNFGSPSFAISSGNADGDGYGNFEYAVPSGYYALCTKNLAEYG